MAKQTYKESEKTLKIVFDLDTEIGTSLWMLDIQFGLHKEVNVHWLTVLLCLYERIIHPHDHYCCAMSMVSLMLVKRFLITRSCV